MYSFLYQPAETSLGSPDIFNLNYDVNEKIILIEWRQPKRDSITHLSVYRTSYLCGINETISSSIRVAFVSPGQDLSGSKILTFRDNALHLDLHIVTYTIQVDNEVEMSLLSMPAAIVANTISKLMQKWRWYMELIDMQWKLFILDTLGGITVS